MDSAPHDPPSAAVQPFSVQQQVDSNDPNTDSSSVSSSSSYHDPSSNDLTLFTGAILLTADCMGTGVLALPADVERLGRGLGLGFLLLQLPINLYAGTILSWCASYVEERILRHSVRPVTTVESDDHLDENANRENDSVEAKQYTSNQNKSRKGYSSVEENDSPLSMTVSGGKEISAGQTELEPGQHHHQHTDTATFDFIGMTSMLFDAPILPTLADQFVTEAFDLDDSATDEDESDNVHHRPITYKHPFTKVVLAIYYTNLFLVLGNYILVMSHAVSAMAGENNLCIPTAGIIASTLMFALSQLRTMSNLGRSVSAVSLIALLIVVVQCLYSLRGSADESENEIMEEDLVEYASYTTAEIALSKMSSLAAICFAVGSQKLLLNIRHEMADRTKAAPGALSLSLSIYGSAYILVCLLAGPQPPSFLFDAIPEGWRRQVAGLLLWIHVAVSYAINSQAFCSSVDRVVGHRVKFCGLDGRHRARWGVLTAIVALLSYTIANAVPFFKVGGADPFLFT